jgi:hypothetical protein
MIAVSVYRIPVDSVNIFIVSDGEEAAKDLEDLAVEPEVQGDDLGAALLVGVGHVLEHGALRLAPLAPRVDEGASEGVDARALVKVEGAVLVLSEELPGAVAVDADVDRDGVEEMLLVEGPVSVSQVVHLVVEVDGADRACLGGAPQHLSHGLHFAPEDFGSR